MNGVLYIAFFLRLRFFMLVIMLRFVLLFLGAFNVQGKSFYGVSRMHCTP